MSWHHSQPCVYFYPNSILSESAEEEILRALETNAWLDTP